MNNIILEWLQDLENNDVQKLDFTKKENVEKLENSINALRKNSIFSCFFEDSVFDSLLEKAKKIYNDAHKDVQQPVKPSTKVNDTVKKNCFNLANEYVNKLIIPYVKKEIMTEETKNDMIDALYEYGCWIYQK